MIYSQIFSDLSLFSFLFLLLKMSISMLSVLHVSHVKCNALNRELIFLLYQQCGANIGGELQSIEPISQKILGCPLDLFGNQSACYLTSTETLVVFIN
jgi:hypothetical protein